MRQTSLATWAREIAQFNRQTSVQLGDFDKGDGEDPFREQSHIVEEDRPVESEPNGPYNVYNTYNDSLHSADGSYNMLCPAFPGGIVRFMLEGGEDIKDRYYVSVPKDASVEDIARFMAAAWRRRTPKLVLTVISSSQYYHPWTREKFQEDFKAGIIQAANLTEMWVLTEGLNRGVSKLIGDAANTEMTRRKNMEQNPLHIKNISSAEIERLPRLNIFGIVPKTSLIYADVLNGQHISPQDVENAGGKPSLKLYELNPDHSHFILVEDGPNPEPEAVSNLRFALEMRFTKAVGKPRRYTHSQLPTSLSTLLGTGSDIIMPLAEIDSMSTPVLGLMVQGGPLDIDHVLLLLKKKIPVIVILGSGGAADLVAFAYHEMKDRSDSDYLDNYIKPELMRRVSEAFPEAFANNEIARNHCRDKVIECVKFAKQEDLTFLTILNTYRHDVRLSDLSKYLLKALFQSQTKSRTGRRWREQLQWDLQLTLDWNRPDLARSEIFNKYNLSKFKVEDHVFHLALLRADREAFVDLFLEHGMVLHLYLNHKRLANLFENATDRDYFVGVCLEGVLGKNVSMHQPLCTNFVDDINCELNRLLYKLTGLSQMINPYELSMNSLGSYLSNPAVAERRAINALVFWAVLTNRQELAKILWKRTDDPMAMALVVSMLLHKLHKRCRDIDMRSKIKEAAKEFGNLAVNMLRLSYKQSSSLTFATLSKKLEDFNNWSVVELAKFAGNKYFLAHHCCQKWMSQRWLGHIRIRELDYGIFGLPDWAKIYLSVFLVFPMFLFISFSASSGKNKSITDDEWEEDLDDMEERSLLLKMSQVDEKTKKPRARQRVKVTFRNMLSQGDGTTKLPFWKQIFYLWTAPITKFWLHQLSYICYLVIISIALLMPACGDFILNTILCVWTLCIWIELVRQTIVRKRMYPEVSILRQCVEIFIIMVFVLIILVFRILPFYVEFISFMTTKFLMAIGLLYFYFRTLNLFLPISPRLGPMLVSSVIMVKKDFFNWMRMFMMVLVSGAVTMHAVIYPSWPLNYVSLRTAFSRAIFGLFLTKIDDIDGGENCKHYYQDENVQYCRAEESLNESQMRELETCANESIFNYAVVVPYLYNAKLIFSTLLFAMFAVTCHRVEKAALEIWKYQRYGMIVDFEQRMVLPPPLGVFCYIYYIARWAIGNIYHTLRRCCRDSSCCKRDFQGHKPAISIVKFRRAGDYNHWKDCINSYVDEEQKEKDEQNRAKSQSDCLSMLMEEVQQHRQLSRQLTDRIVHLESFFTSNCLLLEEMKHMIKGLDPKAQALQQTSKSMIHIAARQSPYPKTSIRRFPVFDKYVPWDTQYETYDPAYYTRPAEEFSGYIIFYVDPDILKIKEEVERRAQLTPEELEGANLPPLPPFHPMYNALLTTLVNDVNIEVDRTSWITQNNGPLRYKLDTSGVPQNPIGRTGIRGRGKLWRWGPNHRIAAVVTRWRRKYSPLGFPLDHLLVDGKRVLEFLVVLRNDTGDLTLPGGNVYGKTTAYSVMCEEFLKSAFLEPEVEGSLKLDQDDMISFFGQFAKATGTTVTSGKVGTSRADTAVSGFSASILYRGYIDDPTNTDNAWREAEVWNFHYELFDMFDDKIKEKEKMWREVSPYMRLYGNQDSIVLEAARIHGAYV